MPSTEISSGMISLSTRRVATYYGKGDELHLNFNFPPLFADWTAKAWPELGFDAFYLLEPGTDWDDGMPAPVGATSGPDRQRMYGLDDLAEYGPLFDDIRNAADAQNRAVAGKRSCGRNTPSNRATAR